MPQNYKNHSRLTPAYHFVLLPLILLFMAVAIYNFIKAMGNDTGRIVAALFLLASIIIVLIAWFSRKFPLMAQDRAIRAEENLRHFSLTGKLLPDSLRISQIVALRFASDAEFEKLVNKAVTEDLSSKAIKQQIDNWREDNYRV